MRPEVNNKPQTVPLDYFKQSNVFQRWKLRLTGLAVLLTVVWLGVGLVRSDRGRLRYSRGPLATVHATWDDQCAACHVDFTPMDRGAGAGLVDGFHASDTLCAACHAGPPHSPFQIASEVQSCAGCHRDHRGRDASLARLPDQGCVDCHADLPKHVESPHTAAFADVSRFAKDDHPEFRIIRERVPDPGHVNFNHRVHLTPGMGGGKPRAGAKIPFTLGQLAEADRNRYRQPGQEPANDAQNVVQLNCGSCHQPDRENLTRADGAYLRPITYEGQCRACHPLTVTEPAGGKPLAVPHRLQPDLLHEMLEGVLASRYLAGKPIVLAEPFEAPRQIPGKSASKEAVSARDFINRQLATAETRLYVGHQTCGECHQFTTPAGIVTLADIQPGAVPKFKVKSNTMPAVWLTHARFDHAAHRSMRCVECHGAAEKSGSSRDVLLPGIDNCLNCHKPGGARTDCTECHRYHQRAK